MRENLTANGGFWPEECNHASSVRKAIHFNQILVSMSGTSHSDSMAVYAQKIYEFEDVTVGYRFVNVVYSNGDTIHVNPQLINDVVEQLGGGGEGLDNAIKRKRMASKLNF
jgi:hypothetical protein